MQDVQSPVSDMPRVRPTWDQYFMEIARVIAIRSPDDKTRVGCIVVRERRIVGTGYNGTPAGFDDGIIDWFGRVKLNYIIHAEANAMLHAYGPDLRGATLYCTHSPCMECARLIAGAGIQRVVYEILYRQEGVNLLHMFGVTADQVSHYEKRGLIAEEWGAC